MLHEIEVECLPIAIPEKFRVEVAELNIGDAIRVSVFLTMPHWAASGQWPSARARGTGSSGFQEAPSRGEGN